MKRYLFIFAFFVSICSSCSEIFDPNVNTENQALVVEGLITDQPGQYIVKLTKTIPFTGMAERYADISAKVAIHDDLGNIYPLIDTGDDIYVSDTTKLTGIPGRSYTLHIETRDGDVYESDPQLLLSGNYTQKAYGVYATEDLLVEDNYGSVSKVTAKGANLLYDITGSKDTALHFRFKPTIITEYFYINDKLFPPIAYYGWYTTKPGVLVNITQEKNQTSSKDIEKHEVCFVNNEYKIGVEDGGTAQAFTAYVVNKILKISQYRLNEDSYKFYKNVNIILAAEGKLFDPIAFQFRGNIHCVNNPQKLVLGIFEASSIRNDYYVLKPMATEFVKIPSFNFPKPWGRLDSIPPYWIN